MVFINNELHHRLSKWDVGLPGAVAPKHPQVGFSKWKGRTIHVVWFCKVRMIVVLNLTCVVWRYVGQIVEFLWDQGTSSEWYRHIGIEQKWRNKLRRDEGAPLSKLCLRRIPQSHTLNTPYLTHSFCIHIVPTALKATFSQNTQQPGNLFWQRTGHHR